MSSIYAQHLDEYIERFSEHFDNTTQIFFVDFKGIVYLKTFRDLSNTFDNISSQVYPLSEDFAEQLRNYIDECGYTFDLTKFFFDESGRLKSEIKFNYVDTLKTVLSDFYKSLNTPVVLEGDGLKNEGAKFCTQEFKPNDEYWQFYTLLGNIKSDYYKKNLEYLDGFITFVQYRHKESIEILRYLISYYDKYKDTFEIFDNRVFYNLDNSNGINVDGFMGPEDTAELFNELRLYQKDKKEEFRDQIRYSN